jgi:hypothetical protein
VPESEVAPALCCNTVADTLVVLVFLDVNVELLDRLSQDDAADCEVRGGEVFLLLPEPVQVSDVDDSGGNFDESAESDNARTLVTTLSGDCCCISAPV